MDQKVWHFFKWPHFVFHKFQSCALDSGCNSARGDIKACFLPLVTYLKEEHLNKRKSTLAIDQLEVHTIPKQRNNYDSGLFTLRYAESITRFGHHGAIDFTQEDFPKLRTLMLYEILLGVSLSWIISLLGNSVDQKLVKV